MLVQRPTSILISSDQSDNIIKKHNAIANDYFVEYVSCSYIFGVVYVSLYTITTISC